MRCMKKYDITIRIGFVLGIASILEAALSSIYLAAATGAMSAIIFAAHRGREAEGRINKDMCVLTEGLITELRMGHPLITSLAKANSPGLSFSSKLSNAICKYRMSSDLEYSFEEMMNSGPKRLKPLAGLLMSTISTGSPADSFLEEGSGGKNASMGLIHKADALMSGSVLISSMGSIIFFPAFAGVGIGILGSFAGLTQAASSGVELLFAFFIIVSNYYGFSSFPSNNITAHYKSVLASFTGLLIMRAVSLISISMI